MQKWVKIVTLIMGLFIMGSVMGWALTPREEGQLDLTIQQMEQRQRMERQMEQLVPPLSVPPGMRAPC